MSGARSKVEAIKEASDHLRRPVAEGLAAGGTHFSEEGYQILKFHGIYQQDDRDLRRGRRRAGQEPAYSFMVRTRLPAGILAGPDQYLALDELAGRYGNGTLRITTRQGLQFHGVLKGDLRRLVGELNGQLVTTLAACGDVVRNVVGCPAPTSDRRPAAELCRQLSDRLLPRTSAYHEIWVDGELAAGGRGDEEPIYGPTYLPRKFKIALAPPGDNCVDVYANDIGLLAVGDRGHWEGFNVLVGGGLGQSHGKKETYPRLATPLAFVPWEGVIPLVEAIVTVQRDHGNRADRSRARLKYLLDERGLEWFRGEVEARLGASLAPPVDGGELCVDDHLGWHAQGNGRFYLGVPVASGRIADGRDARVRTALREAVRRFRPGVRLTPQQNLLLTDLPEEAGEPLMELLRSHGVRLAGELTGARRWSLACPALPTCGLAITEAERALPGVLDRIEADLHELGLAQEPLTVRMTGCPNGCARPYTAELAFVGRSLDRYTVYAGGSFAGTRLARELADLVPRDQLPALVRSLLTLWRDERLPGEGFGDFCHRLGPETLRARTGAVAAGGPR